MTLMVIPVVSGGILGQEGIGGKYLEGLLINEIINYARERHKLRLLRTGVRLPSAPPLFQRNIMRITESKLRRILRKVITESLGGMSPEEQMQFEAWIDDGNAYEKSPGVWVEQTTQYRTEMSYEELQNFFISEYL